MKLRATTAARTTIVWAAFALILASCGQGDQSAVLVSSTEDSSTTEAGADGTENAEPATDSPLPLVGSNPADAPTGPPLVFADTVGEHCGGSGDSIIEMAFGATVLERSTRPTVNPEPDDNSGGEQRPAEVPWATFAVDTWFTDDLGPEIGLWVPDFAGQVGERWLIAASRYAVGNAAGGDVYWCASELATDDLTVEWSERYGGSVAAGETTTEAEATPQTLDAIAQARARWETTAPPSYTFMVSTGTREADQPACGLGEVRVVVQDGAVVQARDVRRHCDVPLDTVADIDQLFDIAVDAAGAVQGDINFDPTYGFIASFAASDRTLERWINVTAFTPGAFPLTTGGFEALNEARVRWQESGVTNYTATIDVRCFCDVQGPIDVTVEQGLVTAVSVEASEVYPLRVEEMFDAIEPLLAGDNAALAFHPQFGYPIAAFLDPSPADDDEIDYAITAFTPLP